MNLSSWAENAGPVVLQKLGSLVLSRRTRGQIITHGALLGSVPHASHRAGRVAVADEVVLRVGVLSQP